MRTQKETTTLVRRAIVEINQKKETDTNQLIKKVCKKYNVSESHIRTVAGYGKSLNKSR